MAVRRPKRAKPARPKKLTPEQLIQLEQIPYLEQKIIALETNLATKSAQSSHQAYVAGIRLVVTLRGELQKLRDIAARPAEKDEDADLTDDELVERYVEGLRELPLPLVDRLLEAIGAARLPVDLRVVPGRG